MKKKNRVKEALKEGKISETINKILMKQLFTSDKSMFGVDPWLTIEGLRDEEEPHESP